MIATVQISVAPGTFLAIVAASALAATLATFLAGRNLLVHVVVLELVFGIILGPEIIGLHPTVLISFFSDLGLGLLFFFAGYEIDMHQIAGSPLRLGLLGWALSLAIAYTIGAGLAAAGIVLSLLYTGSALSTTSIGMLIPLMADAGDLRSRFGTYTLAAGSVGEFGPMLLLTLILSAQSTLHNAVILLVFIGLAVSVAVLAVRSAGRTLPVFERTIDNSSQLMVRWIIVLVFALALLANELGLDLLLGGFAAGVITRQVLRSRELPSFDSKLTAVSFGVFVPFFFVVSGMNLDVAAIFDSASGLVKTLVFFVLFLVVRGTPALLFYRSVLDMRERVALALMSATQLPLVIAITTLAVDTGHMRASTAAELVGGAVLTTLVFPTVAMRVRGERTSREVDLAVVAAE